MARKKKHGAHENHERWLVSYADFITLMFAFFVVMFASSQTDKGKAQQVSEAIKRALEENQVASAIAGILGGAPGDKQRGNAQMKGPGGVQKGGHDRGSPASKPEQKLVELIPSMNLLKQQLKHQIAAGMLQVSMESRGLVVSLKQAAFFPSGKDTIDPATYPTLDEVAAVLAKLPNKVRLEGHTDSVPIHNDRFRSNWDLSTARGVAMLELLTHRCKIAQQRLSVGGYADTVPIDTNQTEDGRGRNRRVDIVILNETGLLAEPVATGEAKPPAKH